MAVSRNPNYIKPQSSPLNVEDEYKKTLRTRSFVDLWDKVHRQLRRNISSLAPPPEDGYDEYNVDNDIDNDSNVYNNSFPSTPQRRYMNLPESILEPSQESILAVTATNSAADSLLLEYFNITFQACIACTNLLASMSLARAHHRTISHLLIKFTFAHSEKNCTDRYDLASIVKLDNPLRPQNLTQFYCVQSRYSLLVGQLMTAHRKICRQVRLGRIIERATGVVTVGTCSVAAVVALVIAVHTVIGAGVVLAAAPMAIMTVPKAAMRWAKLARESCLQRLGVQLDAAAKGAYIMGRDFDTMSRMLRRVHDEMEHERDVARMVLRDDAERRQLVREVAREVEGRAAVMAEQLEELEQHIYLCMITINRSRKMVAQAIMETGGVPSPVAAALA